VTETSNLVYTPVKPQSYTPAH